jgi:hypothetical protein
MNKRTTYLQWAIGDEVTFTTNLFSMAALNNMGQVYRSLGDNEKAKLLCLSHYLSTLLLVRRDHCDTQSHRLPISSGDSSGRPPI